METEDTKGTLRVRLARVRESSILAIRRGDYREVARLTAEAARINQELSEGSPDNS
jgi:hypothetical protein